MIEAKSTIPVTTADGWSVTKRRWFYKVRDQLEKLNNRYSKVGMGTFFDAGLFPWARELEVNWQTIRAELDRVLEHKDDIPSPHEITPENNLISNDKRWKTYLFYVYGHAVEKNLQECPETARLIHRVPGMTTAFFSILAPFKFIPKHRGPYNGVLRYHLGLKVPEPREHCQIFVGPDRAHWEEGKSMFFDDSHIHHVWNATDGERVVLFMDFVRPLPAPISWLNRYFIDLIAESQVIQDGKTQFKKLQRPQYERYQINL